MIGAYLQIALIILLINCLSHVYLVAYFDENSSIFLRSNRSKLYRSYIEEISKLYRRNEPADTLSYTEKTLQVRMTLPNELYPGKRFTKRRRSWNKTIAKHLFCFISYK